MLACHSDGNITSMASNNQNIYFQMDFSPGDENADQSELEVDQRYLSPTCEVSLAKTAPSRAVSQPRNISLSATVTPASSVSPSSASSFFPKLLRDSLSKLLSRRARSAEKESLVSAENYNDNSFDDQILSLSSSTSPETEDIVKESIKNGLPIIPFAYPTFFTTYRRQEADSKMRRKGHSSCQTFNKRRPHPGYEVAADSEDEVFQMENDERGEGGESLPSLDSIVQMAKLQMEDEPMNVPDHQESQSSYVEMSPDSETVDDSTGDCGDYFCMEKRTNSVPLSQNETRRKINCLREKGELIENGFCRRFKKSKKHKEDYALFDFEGTSDYVEMAGSNRKWHFLDFSRKSK